jgi:hypothetical protein
LERSQIEKEDSSFSEEKEAKRLLFPAAPATCFRPSPGSSNRRQKIKVFWFFSSEKNFLLQSAAHAPSQAGGATPQLDVAIRRPEPGGTAV